MANFESRQSNLSNSTEFFGDDVSFCSVEFAVDVREYTIALPFSNLKGFAGPRINQPIDVVTELGNYLVGEHDNLCSAARHSRWHQTPTRPNAHAASD